jgi:enoyl-[acyl-carrier protein] reductase I
MNLLEGKKALIFVIANDKSIAYGIAKNLKEHGAELAFSYASPVLEKRIMPIAEEFGVTVCEMCDLSNDSAIDKLFEIIAEKFGRFDILVHAVAFAPKEALTNRYIETTREAFITTLDVSVYSLVAVARKAESLMNENGSIITLTYYGGEKVVQNYNVMGVAKSALDSTVRYLAVNLGASKSIRVNAISSGPVRTLAASAIGGFKSSLSIVEEIAPLHRQVSIEDCGGAAVYLASDLAKNVTGEILHVDSGCNIIGLVGSGS